MSQLKRDDNHPYLQKQNWSGTPKKGCSDLRFWENNDMYSEESKQKMRDDFDKLEWDTKGYLKTKTT